MKAIDRRLDRLQDRFGLAGETEYDLWLRQSMDSAKRRIAEARELQARLQDLRTGRRSFEGEAKDFVWCDEEPPMDIYTEILYRLLTTKGLAWTTFTPLLGMSEVVLSFLEPENDESRLSKYLVPAGWKDVPHLDEEEKRKLVANAPPSRSHRPVLPGQFADRRTHPDGALPGAWARPSAWSRVS